MEAPRYTAKEIEDGLYCGMDPDVELVAAQYYDALTAENTELRGKLDDVRMGIGCARGQRTTQYCAEVAQRDATITALLEMLRPLPCENSSPYWKAHCVECGWCGLSSSCELERYEAGDCDVLCPLCHNPVDEMDSHDEARIAAVYRRACEIAGRTE